MSDSDWRNANRANWDERVPIHLGPNGYNLSDLHAGQGHLHTLEQAELPPVANKRVLHLQCHFGADTLRLAQQGATVTGLDFSPTAIAAARALAQDLSLSARATFIESDLYDAPNTIPPPHDFDLVFVTWGAITWLPDITRWAQIVAQMLRPGGTLYLAEAHPIAYVFDDATRAPDNRPGLFAPYFQRDPIIGDDPRDYADDAARLANTRTYNWIHPLGDLVTALIKCGLTLDWLREHDAVAWQMFECLVEDADLYRWPDKPWLPLAFSLQATRR